jgi:hypothetical protein
VINQDLSSTVAPLTAADVSALAGARWPMKSARNCKKCGGVATLLLSAVIGYSAWHEGLFFPCQCVGCARVAFNGKLAPGKNRLVSSEAGAKRMN